MSGQRGLVRLWTLALLVFWPLLAEGLEQQDFTLDNGLRVILVREAKAPVLIAQVWYRVGSVDESEGKSGLSHMLEHMMFQGTPAVPAGKFHHLVGENGGEDNASTTYDATNYYIKLAADRAELALRLEADRMRHLSLEEGAFRSENLVVQEERRSRTDADPTSRFMEQFRARIYGSHPYGRPVIGWMADIQQLTIEDLRAWYHRYYAPNNAILVLVGDMELATMAERVRHHFGDIPPLADLSPPAPLPPFQPPIANLDAAKGVAPVAAERFEVTDKAVTLPLWHGSYPVPTLLTAGKEDVYALDLLSTILGGGSSSRLYKRLILEEGLAVSASASYGGYSRSWELFSISALPKSFQAAPAFAAAPEGSPVSPSPAHPPEEHPVAVTGKEALPRIEQIILQEVARLAREPVQERELQRAKNSMIAQHIFSRDSIHEMAAEIGYLSANGLDWLSLIENYPADIAAVRAEDVQRAAARYLRPERLTVGVLQP
ncbi:MAG: insulinase family protein [Magnetococcales bacterium]|nr:insulinase family protein [Magnetococcales bacterium]